MPSSTARIMCSRPCRRMNTKNSLSTPLTSEPRVGNRQNGNGTVKEMVSITNHSRVKPDIPIAITSNVTGGYQMGQAIKAGADIILSKPIAVDELIETLHEMVDKLQTA